MVLVFSDEFNVDGRSFYPGDDPYWEAEDYHYWVGIGIGRPHVAHFLDLCTVNEQLGMVRPRGSHYRGWNFGDHILAERNP